MLLLRSLRQRVVRCSPLPAFNHNSNVLRLYTPFVNEPSSFSRHFSSSSSDSSSNNEEEETKRIAMSIRRGLFRSTSDDDRFDDVESFLSAETSETSETTGSSKTNLDFLDRLAREFTTEELAILKDRFAILTREDDLALGGVFSLRKSSFDEPNDYRAEMTDRAKERMRYIDFMARQKAHLYEEEDALHELERSDIVEFYFGMNRGSSSSSSTSSSSSLKDQQSAAKSVDEMRVLSREDSVLGAHYGGITHTVDLSTATPTTKTTTTAKEQKEEVLVAKKDPLELSRKQLIAVSLQGGVPFVVFGFIDNFIMIVAGDTIDWAFATTFGWSVLTCAALGNMVSDVVGQTAGGAIEAVAGKIGLPDPKLTSAQRSSRLVKTTHIVSGTVGIAFGCFLGMVPLLFIDTAPAVAAAIETVA
jgi:hypothetical protein